MLNLYTPSLGYPNLVKILVISSLTWPDLISIVLAWLGLSC